MDKRIFFPGDRWLYFKIYTGTQMGNGILMNEIFPVIEKLTSKGIVINWHYVRYADPEEHLRLRVELSTNDNFQQVVELIMEPLKRYSENYGIWDIQIGTYKRELERYGPGLITTVESIFTQQSIVAVKLNLITDNLNDKFIRTCLNVLHNIELFFGFSNKELPMFFKKMMNNFSSEFSLAQNHKTQISKMYDRDKDRMLLLFKGFDKKIIDSNFLWMTSLRNIEVFNEYPYQVNVLYDLIHMFVNKVFIKEQRKNETLLYFYLYKLSSYLVHRTPPHDI